MKIAYYEKNIFITFKAVKSQFRIALRGLFA